MSVDQFSKQSFDMKTPQTLIDATAKKVETILKKNFSDYIAFENGSYTISRGSTQVIVVVRPFTESETCIECMSQVVTGARIDGELTSFLLRKNAELHFGAFGLLFDDTITFAHSITGTNVDENELATTVNSVAIIADYYDDEIVKMAGGTCCGDAGEDLEKH
ncbi:MAG: YbjN domain-containing protein [Bacteroidota bacterium]